MTAFSIKRKKKVLFICGSINQTTQMHQIAAELPEYEQRFTPYYVDGMMEFFRRHKLIEFTIAGHKLAKRCMDYLQANRLPVDYRGAEGGYDLVFTCQDQYFPQNIRATKTILVQEGILDPPIPVAWFLATKLRMLPLYLAGTAATGLTDLYDRFCVASAGYRDLFIENGCDPAKLVVTGIPNFDNCRKYLKNDFPHRNYVLVCTSDARETFKLDDRKAFLRRCRAIADGRPMIFKLHPNERYERAKQEIAEHCPGALVFREGSAEEMIANSDVLICQYSSVVYVGLALGKEVHSYFDRAELERLAPLQVHDGSAARNIAQVARHLLEDEAPSESVPAPKVEPERRVA